MTFARRQLYFTFQIGTGDFGLSGAHGTNTVELAGLRAQCSINNFIGPDQCSIDARIHGLTLPQLAQLSGLNSQMVLRNNKIIVRAGDGTAEPVLMFDGQVLFSVMDMSAQPDSMLIVQGVAGLLAAMAPADPTSYPANANAVEVMQYLAGKMSMGFENGLDPAKSHVLATPYFPGTLRDQVMRCAEAAGINWMIDRNVLVIWERLGARKGGEFPVVSPTTGMIGYPVLSGIGISVTTLFNPALRNGQTVIVQSGLPVANGNWNIFELMHELDSELPNGQWFTKFTAVPSNAA